MTVPGNKKVRHGLGDIAALCVILLMAWVPAASANSASQALKTRTALFDRLSQEQGLSQSVVQAIAQDVQGYIWLGTQEGLNRYNGREVRQYEHVHGDPATLSNNDVRSLLVAEDGELWVATDGGGLNRYDRESDSFIHFRHDPEEKTSLSSDRVRVVYQDRSGVIWVGTDGGGLNRKLEGRNEFETFRHEPGNPASLPSDTILALLEDRAGNFWVGTRSGGLALLDRASGTFKQFRHDPEDSRSLSDDAVRSLYEDRDGRLWVGTYGAGLNLLDISYGTFQRFLHDPNNARSLSHNRVRSIFQDYNGTLWVGTDRGLNEWRPSEGGFARYSHSESDDASLSDNSVTTVVQDRGGVLWVGTYNGANRWNYLSDAFTYFQSEGTALRLSSNVVTAVSESRSGELWVGTYGGGLNRINESDGAVTQYRRDNSALPDDRVMVAHADSDGQIWAGTRSGGVVLLDPSSGTMRLFQHDAEDPKSISSNAITSILAEPSGSVWVGTYGGGLNRLDTNSGHFEHFRHNPDDDSSISSDRVLSIYRDRQGTLWLGTENGGLNAMRSDGSGFDVIRHDPDDQGSLSKDSAWLIAEGGDGSLWVGTNGGGLNRWRPEDRRDERVRFTKYRRSDGMPSDSIQGLIEDSDGRMWVSTNRGLARLNPADGELRYYSRNNGLRGNEFHYGATFRTRSSRLLFGGGEGLLAFYPNHLGINRHEPDIVLTAFDRSGPLATRYSIAGGDEELRIDQSNDLVTFSFNGLDYSAPERNLYRYMLAGFDSDWSAPVSYNRATYTNLPAGSYSFHVQASNGDGVWNESGASLDLVIVPPPWATLWAYASYALAILAALILFNRMSAMKLARAQRKREELEALVAERTNELALRNQELENLNDQLKESSLTDTLTGLKNRRFLTEFIETEVAHARRQAGEIEAGEISESLDIAPALSFMMVDLDGFKQINDQYGHPAGDAALLQVRDVLLECCRKSDTVIRWGGDEFLIVSRNTSNRAAEKLAERIRIGLAECSFSLGSGRTGSITGSIGFAVYPFSPLQPDLVSWEQVARIADQCAYIAKENGRNAWVGIYGTRETNAADAKLISTDLESLLAQRRVGIRTSVYGKLRLTEVRQREHS